MMLPTLICESIGWFVHPKTLGLHVYLAAIKKSYLRNSKHIEANAQALVALRNKLSKDYLSMISHYGFAFAVWNTLTSPELQMTNNVLVEKNLSKLASWSNGMTPLR